MFSFCGDSSEDIAIECYENMCDEHDIMLITSKKIFCKSSASVIFLADDSIEIFSQKTDVVLVLTSTVNPRQLNSVLAVVADEAVQNAVELASRYSSVLLDCGLSQRATLTFSSMGEQEDIVCVQRTIKIVEKIISEPCEIAVKHSENDRLQLFCVAVKLLLKNLT